MFKKVLKILQVLHLKAALNIYTKTLKLYNKHLLKISLFNLDPKSLSN